MGETQPEEQQPLADDAQVTDAGAPQQPQQPATQDPDDDGGIKPDTVYHG